MGSQKSAKCYIILGEILLTKSIQEAFTGCQILNILLFMFYFYPHPLPVANHTLVGSLLCIISNIFRAADLDISSTPTIPQSKQFSRIKWQCFSWTVPLEAVGVQFKKKQQLLY